VPLDGWCVGEPTADFVRPSIKGQLGRKHRARAKAFQPPRANAAKDRPRQAACAPGVGGDCRRVQTGSLNGPTTPKNGGSVICLGQWLVRIGPLDYFKQSDRLIQSI